MGYCPRWSGACPWSAGDRYGRHHCSQTGHNEMVDNKVNAVLWNIMFKNTQGYFKGVKKHKHWSGKSDLYYTIWRQQPSAQIGHWRSVSRTQTVQTQYTARLGLPVPVSFTAWLDNFSCPACQRMFMSMFVFLPTNVCIFLRPWITQVVVMFVSPFSGFGLLGHLWIFSSISSLSKNSPSCCFQW